MRQEFQKINKKLEDVKEEVQKLAVAVNQGFEDMKKLLTSEFERLRLQLNVIHVFDRYNEHRNVLKSLQFYNERFLNEQSNKNHEDLLEMCRNPQNRPLLQLAYIESLVNEKQFGPDFLPTLYEFSQCDPSVYLGFTSMIVDDVAELMHLFKVCSTLELGREKRVNETAKASKYDAILVKKLFRNIQTGMLADEMMRQGRCFEKWLKEDFYDKKRPKTQRLDPIADPAAWVEASEWWKPAPGYPLIEADVLLANYPASREYLLVDPGCRMVIAEKIFPTKQTGDYKFAFTFRYQIPSNRTMAFKMTRAYKDGYVCGFRMDIKLRIKDLDTQNLPFGGIQPYYLCEVSEIPSVHCRNDTQRGGICCSHCEYKDNKIQLDKVNRNCRNACPEKRCDVDACLSNPTIRKTDPGCPSYEQVNS